MADDWDTAVLSDLADIVMGQSPSGDACNNYGKGLPLLNGPTEFGGHHPYPVQFTTDPRKFSEDGDLLFCVRGSTTGRMNWADQRYAIGRGIAAIRSKQGKEYRHFIKAVIDTGLPRLLASATGSTFPNVSREQLRNMECVAPPLAEQKAIAHILGTLDDKIELNRKMNESLEAMAQALFKSWFVEPTLSALPNGWSDSTLGKVAGNPRCGIQPDQIAPDTPYIGLEHMPRRCIALSDWGSANGLESNKFAFKCGQILFGKLRPYFHKVGVAPVNGVCSTDILVIEPKTPAWFGFVLGHVSSVEFVNYTDAASTGTKMPRTNWKDISKFKVALPPESLAEKFTEQINPLIDRIIANINESRTLATLRDTLLPKLLSGELRIPEAEKMVEGVV